MTNAEIKTLLHKQSDAQYLATVLADYPPTARPVIGVPPNVLSQWAREAVGYGGWRTLVDEVLTYETYDEVLLGAFVLGEATDITPAEALDRARGYAGLIDSRHLCDAICLALRSLITWPAETLAFLRPWLTSATPFGQRFALVVLLDYFITDQFLPQTLEILEGVQPASPHALDALAWAYCVGLQVNPALALSALQRLPRHGEALAAIRSRALASPRLAETVKDMVKQLDTL